MPKSVAEIAQAVGGVLRGRGDAPLTGAAPLESAGPEDIAYFSDVRYAAKVASSRAGAILVPERFSGEARCPVILVGDPALAMIRAIGALGLDRIPHPFRGVHPLASVDPSAALGREVSIGPFAVVAARARIGDGSVLYPGAFVDGDAVIGDGCILYPNACVMRRCVLGKKVILAPGAVIGADGFGFHPTREGLVPVPQLGTVIVEDGVHVGANSTVDRARFEATRIGRGSALDNLVHVGHNCTIGAHSALAALTGVAGGSKIGSGVLIGGHVGITGYVTIGDRARIGAKSGIGEDVPANGAVWGYYAKERTRALREQAAVGQLPEFLKRMKELEKRVEELQKKLAGG